MKQQNLFVVQQYQRFRVRKGKEEFLIKWAGVNTKTWEPIENILCASAQQIANIRDAYNRKLAQYAQMGLQVKEIQIINPQSQNYLVQQQKLDQEYQKKRPKQSKFNPKIQNKDIDYFESEDRNLRKSKKIGKQCTLNKKIHKKLQRQMNSPKLIQPLNVQKQEHKKNQISPLAEEKYVPKRITLNFKKDNLYQQQKESIVQRDIRQNDGWIDEQVGEINQYVEEEQYKAPSEFKHLKKLICQASGLKRRFLTKGNGYCFQLQYNEKSFQYPIIVHQQYIECFRPDLLAIFYLPKVKQLIN